MSVITPTHACCHRRLHACLTPKLAQCYFVSLYRVCKRYDLSTKSIFADGTEFGRFVLMSAIYDFMPLLAERIRWHTLLHSVAYRPYNALCEAQDMQCHSLAMWTPTLPFVPAVGMFSSVLHTLRVKIAFPLGSQSLSPFPARH